jgi:hypothetical protein
MSCARRPKGGAKDVGGGPTGTAIRLVPQSAQASQVTLVGGQRRVSDGLLFRSCSRVDRLGLQGRRCSSNRQRVISVPSVR